MSLWSWQTAIKAAFLERVDIIAEYDREIRSPSFKMKLPSVIALRQYVRPATHPAFTRFNLFLRDKFACQYCGSAGARGPDLRSCRAASLWRADDLGERHHRVCAVQPKRKGGRTPAEAHMHLNQRAYQPNNHQLQENGRAFPPHFLHATWRDYLYWDSELEA